METSNESSDRPHGPDEPQNDGRTDDRPTEELAAPAGDSGSDEKPVGADSANSSENPAVSDKPEETSTASTGSTADKDRAGSPSEPEKNDADRSKNNQSGSDRSSGFKGKNANKGKGKGSSSGSGNDGSKNSNGLKKSKLLGQTLVLAKFGQMRRLELFTFELPELPPRGTKLVMRTERGVELGEVVSALIPTAADLAAVAEAAAVDGDDAQNETGDSSVPQSSEDNTDVAAKAAGAGAGAGACAGVCDGDCDCSGSDDSQPCMIGSAQLRELILSGKGNFPLNRQNQIMRVASTQDINDQEHLDINTREKKQYCRRQADELGLKMRISSVEHLLGGERIIFYFTSDSRVDFRELVRRLASQYRTRIEMRQIGARDEARLIADYERCGRHCCCQSFLGELQPVSIRMAKVQKATLDPSKISGRCNRLMCCLCYEDQTYEQLRRKLPKRNLWISTHEVVGRVIDTQIITQLVRVIDTKGAVQVVNNEDIIKRNLADPPELPPPPAVERVIDIPVSDTPATDASSRRSSDSSRAGGSPGQKAQPQNGGVGSEGKKPEGDTSENKPGRRRRKPRSARGNTRGSRNTRGGSRNAGSSQQSGQGGQGGGGNTSGRGSSQSSGDAAKGNAPKRRRRRRKPKGGGSGGQGGGGNSGGGQGGGSPSS